MRAWLLMIVTASILSVCGCTPARPLPGTPEAFDSICDRLHQGLDLAVEGYLRLPDTLDGTNSVMLRLYQDRLFTGKSVGVNVKFGNGPNEAARITSAYNDEDLKVHLADGRVIPFGTRVRVSGRVYFPILPQDIGCALNRPYIEAAK